MGYNAMDDKIENLMEAGVIDPAKVTRNGLLNSCSIASIMLTTQVGGRGGGGEPAACFLASSMLTTHVVGGGGKGGQRHAPWLASSSQHMCGGVGGEVGGASISFTTRVCEGGGPVSSLQHVCWLGGGPASLS